MSKIGFNFDRRMTVEGEGSVTRKYHQRRCRYYVTARRCVKFFIFIHRTTPAVENLEMLHIKLRRQLDVSFAYSSGGLCEESVWFICARTSRYLNGGVKNGNEFMSLSIRAYEFAG